MYKAKVIVKRKPPILDPQGAAVEKGAENLGLKNIKGTRIGKYIEFSIDVNEKKEAVNEVEKYCSKLLANPIMEDFEYTLEEVNHA